MNLPRTVPSVLGIHASAQGVLTHRCPFVDETDVGYVEISWRTGWHTLELHSLAEYLTSYAERRISHEEATQEIHYDLQTLPGIDAVSVTTTWTTGGMEVTCSTSPTPRRLGSEQR